MKTSKFGERMRCDDAYWLAVVASALLAACGGGGGGNNPPTALSD